MAISGQDQYLIFKIGSQQCATPIVEVCEVVLMAELSTPAGLSNGIVGILNLGGEAIPVLNLSLLLGLAECEAGLYSHILLTRIKDGTVGFLSQAVEKVMTVTQHSLKPMPAQTSLQGYALAMMPDGKDFVAILSLKAIANASERSAIVTESLLSIATTPDHLDKAS